jgi:hypothetical protein
VDAVLSHRWGQGYPRAAHDQHDYDSACGVCQEDVPAVLAVAAPHIAAAALRQVAEELWDRMDGERSSLIYGAYLRRQADELDGRQPSPDTRDSILAIADGHAAHMRERTKCYMGHDATGPDGCQGACDG